MPGSHSSMMPFGSTVASLPTRGGLTAFQQEVAQTFFTLDESHGFVVAGGAALIANKIVDRSTEDLDLFTSRGRGDVGGASRALDILARQRGWTCTIEREFPGFVRLSLTATSGEIVIVDLAEDASPIIPPTVSVLGPTLAVEESAGQKTLALFGRGEPRDFVDVHALAQLFGRDRLIDLAAERDAGFLPSVLAEMIDQLDVIHDDELDVDPGQIPALRQFYADWGKQLRQQG
ncbi:Predicted nucleotidyltransferase component of viral defense system [Sanguibacter gelidistatuariae]|uniref:Predicted nucleotidyltransferase component of viral defense system n=1 Tax=Sanguibacter gelidistatuariae TaxID=1814289 RepID=A0A1G6S4Q9_9MICO|nr:nucleotidyl transferase AbiEii/AbiGii toxin family protein [Sanguibacter gelidistatuariae]SDD11664.1 Predicted nucleotidyltransferase component of viral defense system [Sanguibacter gelidistatuariae]